MSKSRILVWDLPTRLFHWFVTVGLIACFAFALLSDEHGSGFMTHMILGIVLGTMVAMRVVWGFVGIRYARFDSFLFGPAKVLSYFRGAFTGQEREYVGHNPGSSYGIFAMLALLGMAVVTGLMMSGGNEAAVEIHAASSYALLAVVGVHLIGVIWYSVWHRENITLSMITGTKDGGAADAIPSSRRIAALAFVAVVGIVAGGLFQNFDRTKGQTRMPLLNIVIPLGEVEEGGDHDRGGAAHPYRLIVNSVAVKFSRLASSVTPPAGSLVARCVDAPELRIWPEINVDRGRPELPNQGGDLRT